MALLYFFLAFLFFMFTSFTVRNSAHSAWQRSDIFIHLTVMFYYIRVRWGKTDLDISAWFFCFFFSIKLFDRVIIGIFSNRLNHWTQIYLKFLKLVLLFRIGIQKVVKNGTRHRPFFKKKKAFSTTMVCVHHSY